MKIAILRKKYVFHGGSESFSSNLIKKLSDEGHEIHVFAIKWEVSGNLKNIYFHKIPAISFNSLLRDCTFAFSSSLILKKHRKDLDIIQSHDKTIYQDVYRAGDGCHLAWLKQRWKRKGLFGKFFIALNPYHWLILFLERKIFKGHKFKKIIAISEMVKKNIRDNYDVREEDIQVIYNGVDLDKFNILNKGLYRNEIRARYSIAGDDFVLLFVGSGFERKGVEHLLKAAELVPHPLTVLIAGKGRQKRFEHMGKRQQVIFCGAQKEIHKFYAASDLFVFPTIYEPFGNVHLEALASGIPVITTGLSGAAEIIEDGTHGFVVPFPENHVAIAEKIKLLMEDKGQIELMGLNARRLAENFSFEKHYQRILMLYTSLLETKN